MAETRESFAILEDGLGEGISYVGKAPGAAQSTEEQAPVLPAVDLAGNLQNIPVRAVGDADSDGLPAFAWRDSSGDLTRPQLTADGKVPVSFDAVGTAQSVSGNATIAALNTQQDVVSISIANDERITVSQGMGGCFQPGIFVLYHNDNSTLNELARWVVGPGDFQHTANMENITFTAGASGTQSMVLRFTQLRGKLTDAHGTISLLNLGV